jgi:DNA-binding response OmpR family regulator
MAKPCHTLLVIEDDPAIRRGIVDALRFQGHTVHEAVTAAEGMDSARKVECDLVLLDLALPGGDGLDILREVRRIRPRLPVIILTARGDERDRVAGLEDGADDYVVKPFSVRELLARVDAVLRRSAERPSDLARHRCRGLEIDLARREISFTDGAREELTERECELLRHLICNPGRAISRDELLADVWRINPRAIVETRTVDMAIARLRGKLRDDPREPQVLLTVRGKGYMIATDSD